jgi:hypothetical protein
MQRGLGLAMSDAGIPEAEAAELDRHFYEVCDKAKRDHDRDSGVYQAEIARLALLPSDLQYQLERRSAAKRLDIPVSALDRMVKDERAKKAKKKPAAPAFDSDELRRSAAAIIKCPDILGLFAKEFSKVIAGEAVNGKLLYLIATSRLFDKPMNAAIKGTSAGGKSEIRKRILGFFPPEDVVAFTSLSDKALIYHEGDFAHKILSMGEATATEEQTFQDYLLRELMSEGRIRYPTAQKVGNEIKTVIIEKEGPVAFLVTTTKSKMHPENETRMLSLEIDDSEGQTRKVLDKVAQVEGLNHSAVQIDYGPWQDFQRWLAAGERRVVVPFAAELAELIPPAAVRLRRDIGQVIRAIKAHALLHRDQRDRDEAGQIIADIDHDYEAVRKLMNAIIAEGSGVAVNPAITETIDAVTKATIGMTQAEGASAKDIGRALKLDKSAAWRRLSAACDDGYVVNLEQRKGMPGKYRTAEQKVEPVAILPVTAALAERFQNICASVSPSKIDEPCNRDEIADISQADTGCKDGLQPDATEQPVTPDGLHGCKRLQMGLATDKPLDGNGKSPPVARFQPFSGGTAEVVPDDDLTIPPLLDRRGETGRTCAQCGAGRPDDQPTIAVTARSGATVYVHERGCLKIWQRENQSGPSKPGTCP